MATNKNQHFVPRAYLKPFSDEGGGLAITLFNLDHERLIPVAPLKSQCSRSYFYGEDLVVERALQMVEGRYAELTRQVVLPRYVLNEEDKSFLRQFWLIQHLRTESASIRMVEMSAGLQNAAGIAAEEFKLGVKEAVRIAMSVAIEELPSVQDMKVCLLRNRTPEPFITSDDPAVLTNLWHLESPIPQGKSFGMGAAGSIYLLPIAPRIHFIAYDGDVYNIPHEKGWVDVRRTADVHAINQHQFLNCRANIYVHDKVHEESVRSQFAVAKERRPTPRHRLHYAVYDGMKDGAETFKVVKSREEAPEHTRALLHTETIHPRPTGWPLQIGRRRNGAVFTDGSGLGFVRHMNDMREPHFLKLRPW